MALAIITMLAYINNYRNLYQAPPVTYSLNIQSSAQSWANYLAENSIFKHSNASYGENIAMIYNTNNDTKSVLESIDLWMSEYKNYNYCAPGYSAKTGHFTQFIWASVKEIGVGVATDKKNNNYVIMQFNPPGNYLNNFAANVLCKLC